jgi:SAM-dependent methyltransferase
LGSEDGEVGTSNDPLSATLAEREAFRERYQRERDPIAGDRLLWRAQTFRHISHLRPGQSVLEIGCGDGAFARQLSRVSRGQNPITALSFDRASFGRVVEDNSPAATTNVEYVHAEAFPAELKGRAFDFIVARDVLDHRNCAVVLSHVHDLLKPGGQFLFYETNPWNVVLKLRRLVSRVFGRRDPRELLSRQQLYELISEVGFIRVFAVFNDFVYRPIPRGLAWLFRNLSILLENAPGLQTLAGSILVHAKKPPRVVPLPAVSLCEHASLRGAVSVVIPCHNEEMNLPPLVNSLRELFGDYLHEIIPVDDNSRDNTRKVIEELAASDPRIKPVFRTPPNGVGRAIADGYRVATGKWVLSMDCDFQHLLPEVRDLFDAAAQGHDVVVGSRFSRHSVLLNYPFQKIVANRVFHMLARVLLRRRFRDLTNNLKLIRRDVLQKLVLVQPGFAVNAETGLQPLLMGCSVCEVPISWINRTPDMGVSSFKLMKVGGGYQKVLWHLWLRLFGLGPYRDLAKLGDERCTTRQAVQRRRLPHAA